MKNILFLWMIMLTGITYAKAQEIFVCRHVHISFFSSAPIEDIKAATEKGVSAINCQTGKIYFKIPIRSFQFPKALMQEHFNENFMESDAYPYSIFKGKIISPVDLTKEGQYHVAVEGKLTIHGVTKTYRETGSMLVKDGQIALSADFKVRLADHNITIPRILFKNIAEVISVKVRAKYRPK